MAFLLQVFVFLHIVMAAAWFGMALRLATQARTVLSLEQGAALALADDVARTVRFMGIFIVLTFIFAMGVLGLGGGYPGQFQYHTASLLIVVLVVVQYVLIGPAWKKLRAAVEAGTDAEAFRKRVAMGVGIGHLLWLVLLVLMFWNRFRAVL